MKGTRLEVNLSALAHNFKFLKSRISPQTLFMSVVKANAYGHGICKVAHKLQELGTDYFATAYIEEAVVLRQSGIKKPILVLHPQAHHLEKCIQFDIEPVIYCVELLDAYIAFAKAGKKKTNLLHLEFNTGLNRIGIDPKDIPTVLEKIKDQDFLKVQGLQSHLAASEDLKEKEFTERQIRTFHALCDEVEESLGYACIRHTDNTSGILNYEHSHYSMVRSGIGLYGYGNDQEVDKYFRPIGSLYSNISQIRKIKKGESISYNRSHRADRDMTYAVVALGHGDGFNRIYGYGKAQVIINGQSAPTLGIICMDMFMVDITHIDCRVGDPVTIFDEDYPARDRALQAGTISYELLTGIQTRVPRLYVTD